MMGGVQKVGVGPPPLGCPKLTANGHEFKGLNYMGYLRLVGRLPAAIYSGELIFKYEYLLKYEAKIDETEHGVGGP